MNVTAARSMLAYDIELDTAADHARAHQCRLKMGRIVIGCIDVSNDSLQTGLEAIH